MSILIPKRIFIATRPIFRINTPLDQPVKSRMRPIRQPFDQAMFERVDVDVIHVCSEISLIANQVFPITALPNAPLVARNTNLGATLCFWQGLGKRYLD